MTPTTPLRVAFGNEGSPRVIEEAATRFGVRIIDVFGSTEGGIALDRTGARPPTSIGRLREGIKVVDEEGNEVPRAVFDAEGGLTNADRSVGEIVNTLGVGPFEGYYRNDEAMQRTTRHGWYWSGDLGYVDQDGWVYFAGRTSDWLRVDGENFPATPIEAIIARHPDLILASVYGVPEPDSGDQVMCALVLREGRDLRRRHVCQVAGRPARPESEVAAPLRAAEHGAADDTDQQGAGPHLVAPEVPLGPGGRGPRSSSGSGAVTTTAHSRQQDERRPVQGLRGQRPRRGLGTLSRSGSSGAMKVELSSS